MMAIGDGIALAVLNMDCLHRAGASNVILVPKRQPNTPGKKPPGHLSSSGDDPQTRRPPT